MTEAHHQPGFASWLRATAAGMLTLLILLPVLVVAYVKFNCWSHVNNRNDQRAMWDYLIDQNPDSPQLPAFVAAYEERIPELECEWWNPFPVEVDR